MVMLAGICLFGVWMYTHWGRIAGDADALIRFTLGILFAVMIILRGKDHDNIKIRLPQWTVLLTLTTGMIAVVSGIIFKIHILEWIGVLLLLFSCSAWVAPDRYGADLMIAFTILFWMHPIPGQVFGWLQSEMQRLSVIGSEMVLHTVNVRVWGDSAMKVLRTGYQDFMVPESCSGMRTAVTVFLCTLGVGTLLRLKWYETCFFVVLGLAQVLVLNIIRISYMVLWAPRMPPEWAENFLHDSLSVFLMGAILLVQLEAAWWHMWSSRRRAIKLGIRKNEIERPDKASVVPHSLRRLGFILTIMVAIGIIGMGVFGVVYKSRAYHRKEMIREVAEGLIDTDPEVANRAIKVALKLVPADSELLSMQARTYFVRGMFDEGLAVFADKEAAGDVLSLEETVLKSWALMRLDRIKEARKIVDSLPPDAADNRPGVAMLKAEFAAMDEKPDEVAHYVVLASRSYQMLGRIRRLFPYLAMHEQWDAIVKSDNDKPYDEVYQALIAIYANQKTDDLAGVAKVMAQVVKMWPDDIRFMPDLYRLTLKRQGSEWESLFEHNLLVNVKKLSPDRLAMVQDYCWRIARPDLAWIVFSNLQLLDENDPALLVAPAQYGHQWCMFRRHQINVQAENPLERLDLLPLIDLFSECKPFQGFAKRIPLLDEAGASVDPKVRKQYLVQCLKELKWREDEAPLNNRLLRLYPIVLVMTGEFDEAHKRLDDMLETHPKQTGDIIFQHAVFYDQQGKWQESYEALRKYEAKKSRPNLRADLIMIKSCMNLNMGIYAMDLLKKARIRFPNSFRLDLAESAIWDVFGFKEQALHVISRTLGGATSPVSVGLLYDTGRINASRTLSEATGVPLPSYPARQMMRLPSAEFSMVRRWPPAPDADERLRRIDELDLLIQKSSSPYFKLLFGLELAWHNGIQDRTESTDSETGNGEAFDAEECRNIITQWESVGRDDRERVGSLYQLAMLAGRQGIWAVADMALERCTEIMPESQIAWRARIAVTEGDENVVNEAYSHCPEDTEIMLANLVTETKKNMRKTVSAISTSETSGSNSVSWAWATNIVNKITASDAFSPGTFVRAGDYLLSKKQVNLAEDLARIAIPKGRGLLAAYVLGLRTALVQGNAEWAESCAVSGIENALDPTPFYKTMVDIKAVGRKVDSYLIEALEYLQDQKKSEKQWAEMLGKIYFQKGDMQRSLSIFSSVMRGDTKNVNIGTLILAAEAARRNSKIDRAVSILESAYAMQPDQLSVLNNLVYLLAQDPGTLARAKALMPRLLSMGSDSFAVMDTAAIVYLRSGDIEKAQLWMAKAMAAIKDDSYSAQEVRLNAAELKIRSGKYNEARDSISELRQDSTRTDYIDQKARGLLREIESLGEGM